MSRIHQAKVHIRKKEEVVGLNSLNTEMSGRGVIKMNSYQMLLRGARAAPSSTAVQSCQLTALSQAGF